MKTSSSIQTSFVPPPPSTPVWHSLDCASTDLVHHRNCLFVIIRPGGILSREKITHTTPRLCTCSYKANITGCPAHALIHEPELGRQPELRSKSNTRKRRNNIVYQGCTASWLVTDTDKRQMPTHRTCVRSFMPFRPGPISHSLPPRLRCSRTVHREQPVTDHDRPGTSLDDNPPW